MNMRIKKEEEKTLPIINSIKNQICYEGSNFIQSKNKRQLNKRGKGGFHYDVKLETDLKE